MCSIMTREYRTCENPGLVLVPDASSNSNPVTTGLHDDPVSSLHTNRPNCLHYFLLSENVLNYKNGTKIFYIACRTLLVMLCVGKYCGL